MIPKDFFAAGSLRNPAKHSDSMGPSDFAALRSVPQRILMFNGP